MAACGGWSISCYPHFLAAENGGNAVKRAARGCRPWTPRVPLDGLPRKGGNVGDWLFYRFLSVDATERRPCVRGAVPVRTLGLRGCNRFSESDETAGEGHRKSESSSSASSARLWVQVTTPPIPVCALVPPPLTQGRLGAVQILPLKQGEDRAGTAQVGFICSPQGLPTTANTASSSTFLPE